MDWLINRYTAIARTLASIGISAIIVLSVVLATTALLAALGKGQNTLQPLP